MSHSRPAQPPSGGQKKGSGMFFATPSTTREAPAWMQSRTVSSSVVFCLETRTFYILGCLGSHHVRTSNEGSLRPRVARAQGIARPPFFPFFSLHSSSPVLEGVAKAALNCAHRTRAFLGRAFCEQGGHLAAPFRSLPTLASASPPPVQCPCNPLAF
jgi:hypothetical protein